MSLSKEIHAFLEKYAKISASYDAEYDDPEDRFNGPDSAMLEIAAKQIENGETPIRVFSEWGSGCYKTNLDSEGFSIHQDLVERIYKLI